MVLRKALLKDAEAIFEITNYYAGKGLMLMRSRYQIYEAIRDFTVAEDEGKVIGFGALHILGEDLAEVRTTAIDPEYVRKGVGQKIVDSLLEEGRQIGVSKAFTLTYQPEFFGMCGFVEEDKNRTHHKLNP